MFGFPGLGFNPGLFSLPGGFRFAQLCQFFPFSLDTGRFRFLFGLDAGLFGFILQAGIQGRLKVLPGFLQDFLSVREKFLKLRFG